MTPKPTERIRRWTRNRLSTGPRDGRNARLTDGSVGGRGDGLGGERRDGSGLGDGRRDGSGLGDGGGLEAELADWLRTCRLDLRANTGYPKSQLVLLMFRTAQFLRSARQPGLRALYPPFGVLYKVASEWVLGIELPASTPVGPGLRLRHGVGTVVNPHARIGSGVMLRHGVTIGNRRSAKDCPVIEDDVELGVGVVVIGAVRIGARSQVAAGTVVLEDIPADSVVYTKRDLTIRPRTPAPNPEDDSLESQ